MFVCKECQEKHLSKYARELSREDLLRISFGPCEMCKVKNAQECADIPSSASHMWKH